MLPVLAFAVMGASCPTPTLRLRATYDNEPVNAFPQMQPAPSPPHDFFTWGKVDITAQVRAIGGGKLVEVRPNRNYLDTGKYRAFIATGYSDAIQTANAPQLRGALTFDLQGSGRMVVAIRIAHERFQTDPIAGFLISVGGGIGYMSQQNLRVMDINDHILNATALGPLKPTFSVELRWSIDQPSRTVNLGMYPSGGTAASTSVTFQPTGPNGAPNIPIKQLLVEILGFEAGRDFIARFDNLLVEQLP